MAKTDQGEHVSFNDNLYGGVEILRKFGGCGLKGWCRNASWSYERHDVLCKPGKWLVSLTAPLPGSFSELLYPTADAVMDDFGTLQRVQA